MATPARARDEHIQFRTTVGVRRLVDRAVAASVTNLNRLRRGQPRHRRAAVMADRDRFELPERATAQWEAINARPARDLPGLRRLLQRPSPLDG